MSSQSQHPQAATVRCSVMLQALGLILSTILLTCDTLSSSQDIHQNNTTNNDGMQQELLSKLVSSKRSQVYEDPFAITFEDFLKEANKISIHHISTSPKDSTPAISNDNAALIVEEESAPEGQPTNTESPNSDPSLNEHIFPLTKPQTSQQELKYDNSNYSTSLPLVAGIQLMFSWERLLTHKCSRTCGKGYRMYHLSCVDLEYKVRVEDELCSKANLTKPKELSDEPCNQIDCPPEWTSLEFQECTSEFNKDGNCKRNLYKREQCVMVNRDGIQVILNQSRCNLTASTPSEIQVQTTGSNNHAPQSKAVNLPDSSLDYSLDDIEKNSILFNTNQETIGNTDSYTSDHRDGTAKDTNNRRSSEPFFYVGPWSECSGAPVNKLGQRTRDVICRLYLSRSSKYTNLPDSSCRGLLYPEKEEPCYMDSGPTNFDAGSIQVNSTDFEALSYDNQNVDETVYDSDLTRYIWREDGWTRCSAECLGGKRESLIECWDKVAGIVASQSLCDLQSKPIPTIEGCNNIPCPVTVEEEFPESRLTHSESSDSSSYQNDYSFDDIEKNIIVPNINHATTGYMDEYNFDHEDRIAKSSNIRHNEPFFYAGPWSECSGAPVNKLGKRTRDVICRLYLSRSFKFTDLPDSSCRGLLYPEKEEPCYMDSGPATNDLGLTPIKSTDFRAMSYDNQNLDETVYDPDLSRYIWRKYGWTKSRSECIGGQRESLIECWDKVAGIVASHSLCDSQSRPIPTIEECNNIPKRKKKRKRRKKKKRKESSRNPLM